ncbi:fungal-specific transcription factor domain-containing protein [Amylostereum chailletii]|nr:fungal-specific transcription factor domain-containing protein [Amylostereum chailletii]
MSSAEDDVNDSCRDSKKRKVQRACDVCRRKKGAAGDGSQMPGNKCSNCLAYNLECSYVEAARKRGPPKGYVESLENRLEKMEDLLNRLCPDADFTQELGMPLDRESWLRDRRLGESSHRPISNQSSFSVRRPPTPPNQHQPQSQHGPHARVVDTDNIEPSDDEEGEQLRNLTERFEHISLGYRFFGKSSGVRLIKTALDLKMEYAGRDADEVMETWDLRRRRPAFWSLHPWERARIESVKVYDFPEPDLLRDLVELYFDHINVVFPLLHRPTLEAGVASGLHLKDEAFGAVVLILCACASRFSNDPRVILPGTDAWNSSGWRWFEQVQMSRNSMMTSPRLPDLQVFCLGCQFLQGCSAPQACWTLCGIGIRLAQDVGAHRRKVYSPTPTVEDELWKRAFWMLVVMDRWMSASLGRPCAIQEEDFDLDLPADCDDEYWTHPDPAQAFKQPSGKPSSISFFISAIKLNQILGFALRTIYSINKSKVLLGFVGHQWEQHIVAELDSALNKWVDSVPDHLRWDPTRENGVFFLQSAVIYSQFYQMQIMVHRPFIPSPNKPSPLSFPSLAICTNAARSCSHILDHTRRRSLGRAFPFLQLPAFTAGIVLLLSIWGFRRSGVSIDPSKEMEDVHKCMHILKDTEGRWHTSGRLWDVLYELASVGDLPLPQASTPTYKRERDADSPASATSSTPSNPSSSTDRTFAGARRVSRSKIPAPQLNDAVPLPVRSDELARLPIHANVPGAPPPPPPWYVHPGMPRQLFEPESMAGVGVGGWGAGMDVGGADVGGAGVSTAPGLFESLMQGMPQGQVDDPGVGVGVGVSGMGAPGMGMEDINMGYMWSGVPAGYG